MPEFQTVDRELFKFGTNKFIEIARKKVIDNDRENVYIAISRGYINSQGEEIFQRGKQISLPDIKELKEFISEHIKDI